MRRIFTAGLAVAVLGCGGGPRPGPTRAAAWVPEPAPDMGPMVARVGDVPVFAAEVAAQARRTGQPPRQALDELIAFHLLAEKARAAGVQPDPASAPRELLVQRLLEREFEPATQASAIGDDELRRLYDRARDHFVHPRLVEAAILAVFTGERMKPEPRGRLRALAQELAEVVARRPLRTADDFETVANDARWSGKVALRRLLLGPERPFGATVGAAAMRLGKPGDTTPLVEDETGLYVVRYVSERAPENVSFEAAREQLRQQAYPYWQQQRFGELVAAMARRHDVAADPDKLAAAEAPAP